MRLRRATTAALAALILALTLAAPAPASAQSGPDRPLPAPVAPAGEPIEELQETIAALVARYQTAGDYAFAVTDLQTGETVGSGMSRPQLTACTVNFFVLLQATIDVQEGRYPEAEVGDLIARTIWSSNPVTARDLYTIVGDGDTTHGVRRVARLIDELSLDDTILDHPPGFSKHTLGVNRNNWTTAADMNRALAALYDEELLQPRWRDYLLEHMTRVKPGLNYLTAIGPTVPVSHKNGFFRATDQTWVDNDIALVRIETEAGPRAYAVSFFSQWVPWKYADLALGQRLSVAAWDFFSARYPLATERR